MKRAEIFRKYAGNRSRAAAPAIPTGSERMAAWEDESRNRSAGMDRGAARSSTTFRPAARNTMPLKDGSFLAQGYAPTKHTVKMTVKTDVQNITAFRLELLTDPNLPLGGPGRSIKGTGALTEFEVEAAPADAPDKTSRRSNSPRPRRMSIRRRRRSRRSIDDKTDKRRVTGPVEFAIDGKDETAWGIDAGPGLRNQPRKAVFTARRRRSPIPAARF